MTSEPSQPSGPAGSAPPENRAEGERIEDLEDILDLLQERADQSDPVSLEMMLETVGRRCYGPILLLVGLLAVTPLSGIPGIPTALGTVVLLISGQLIAGRKSFWLPRWVLSRKVPGQRLAQGVRLMRKPARVIDRFLRPRLTFLTRHVGYWLIVTISALIAATMPPLELLPFVATTAGAALTTFALALIANDGLLALIALGFTGGTAAIVITQLNGG